LNMLKMTVFLILPILDSVRPSQLLDVRTVRVNGQAWGTPAADIASGAFRPRA